MAIFGFLLAGLPQAPRDAPFSPAFGTGMGERENLFVTSSGLLGTLVPGLPWPGPGLVKLEVGIPGLPLPRFSSELEQRALDAPGAGSRALQSA